MDFAEGALEEHTYAIRFADSEKANEFKKVYDEGREANKAIADAEADATAAAAEEAAPAEGAAPAEDGAAAPAEA